jgi:hypothetical protein
LKRFHLSAPDSAGSIPDDEGLEHVGRGRPDAGSDFDMIARATPFIKKVKNGPFYPDRIANDMIRIAAELFQFVQQFPRDLLENHPDDQTAKLTIKMEHEACGYVGHPRPDQHRISFSIIIAALVVGSALIVISIKPPFIYGISLSNHRFLSPLQSWAFGC